jgi:hypothetical protein
MKVLSKSAPVPVRTAIPWRWVTVAMAGLILVLVGGAALTRPGLAPATGTLTPEQVRYDFGEVAIGEGLLVTQIPLAVEGTVRVTTLESS